MHRYEYEASYSISPCPQTRHNKFSAEIAATVSSESLAEIIIMSKNITAKHALYVSHATQYRPGPNTEHASAIEGLEYLGPNADSELQVVASHLH